MRGSAFARADATHNVSFVEWDPVFEFANVTFSAYWDLTTDPHQQTNLWSELPLVQQSAWRAELEAEFSCHGHHGRATDCA